MFERDGMLHLNAVLDAESAAPVKAAIRGYVSAVFAARKDRPGAEPSTTGSDSPVAGDRPVAGGSPVAEGDPDADRRSVAMIQADALSMLCGHALGCDADQLPLAGATVIVRLSFEDLLSGSGTATIDGTDQPISISAARRMAAGGTVIPWVMGGDSEVLDWGRERRLFTKAQRRALTERDGGCAMCFLPPEMTKVHHISWWERDAGPTDLDNGILLCETCHHRIHDNGWDIHIDGTGVAARVWFLPPPYVDPARTPRLGGRARFDVVA
jgi:5-methylcytosine-specific restriction protein A